MFNAVCFDEMHASEYEDWQGERDRQVHNFPWCKTFCYMSTSFENQFRENRNNEELDKKQLKRFLDIALRPQF